MDRFPLISIIVPVYNVEQYIRQCVDSIIKQTYRNIEIILVDDGSTDFSPAICDDYAKDDCRIKVIHKKNGGLSSARNAGVEIASGEYVGFVDSDDWIAEEMYEKLLSGFTDENIGVVSSGAILINDTGKNISDIKVLKINESQKVEGSGFFGFYVDNISVIPTLNVWNKLYRRDVLSSMRFVEGRNCEDVYYMYHLSKVLEEKAMDMVLIPDGLYYYRIRENSITQSKNKPHDIDLIKNMREILDDYPHKGSKEYKALMHKFIWHLNFGIEKILKDKDLYQRYFCEIRAYILNTRTSDFAEGYDGLGKLKVIMSVMILKYCPGLYRKILIRS